MLRKDSGKDMAFVEGLAAKLKLPVTCAQVNIKALARRGSLEEIARNARLSFFFRVAKEVKADKIALGHNLDDQAETVLMRILRGAGLYGLSGILPKRNLYGYEIIRPLIEVRRKEIEAFLKLKKIRPRIDTSNRQDLYFRNKIRNKLLPLLEKEYNSGAKEILANMAETVGYDYDYLNWVANRAIERAKAKIDLKKFCNLHPAIQRLILRSMVARLKGDTRRLTLKHIREIEDLLSFRPLNSVVDLPKGISVVKRKNSLYFYRRKKLK
jgi:tRNA(Ile)-lysidine synthase